MTTLIERIKAHNHLGDDDVVGVKAGPAVKLTVDEDTRVFEAIANTGCVDLDDEVVVPEGADLSYFQKNKTIFYNHDYAQPIGTMRHTRLINKGGEKVWVVGGAMSRTEFANDVLTMMDEGVIRGTSIGFRAKESRRPTEDETAKYGKHRSIVPEWDWLELSITGMPCNASAMIQSVTKSASSKTLLDGLDDALRKNKISRKSARLMGLPDKRRVIVVVG